jgi:hypothetical protein
VGRELGEDAREQIEELRLLELPGDPIAEEAVAERRAVLGQEAFPDRAWVER